MGQRPNLKQTSKGEEHRKQVLSLLHYENAPITEIARRVGLTTRMVRYHIERGRTSAKAVTAEVADQMRQLEVAKIHRDDEKALLVWNELQLAAERLKRVIELGDNKLVCAASIALAKVGESIARLRDASTAGSAQVSKLFGLYQPQRIIEEQLRLSITKSEHKVTVSWDKSMLDKPSQPVPNLFIGGRTRTTAELEDAGLAIATPGESNAPGSSHANAASL
jgi:hypothetical protein